jgi:hypothetical protein
MMVLKAAVKMSTGSSSGEGEPLRRSIVFFGDSISDIGHRSVRVFGLLWTQTDGRHKMQD